MTRRVARRGGVAGRARLARGPVAGRPPRRRADRARRPAGHRGRRPRELLHRIEAMRTMVWRAPLVRAPDDAAMASLLTELRRPSAAAVDPDADPDARRAADRQRLRVEREIRALSRRARGRRGEATTTEDAVAEALGDARRAATCSPTPTSTGRLCAVVARGGRTSLHDLGDVAALDEHLEVCAFALHRLNRVQGSDGVARRGRPAARRRRDVARRPAAAGDGRPFGSTRSSSSRPAPCTACRGPRWRRCGAGRSRSARR